MSKHKEGDVFHSKMQGRNVTITAAYKDLTYDVRTEDGMVFHTRLSPDYFTKVTNTDERKGIPVYTGVLAYFPDAIKEVAKASAAGQNQHNPDKPLAWDRSKSGDEVNSLSRHLVDRASGEVYDTDGVRHLAKVAWRALAALQKEVENG